MKKILTVLMIILFLLGMQHTDIKEYTHIDDNSSYEHAEVLEQPSELPELLNSTLTVTAVGDCTLATDINAKGPTSFDATFESVNSDYSYFFKNVKSYFENDDLTIVNFEGTLSDRGSRANKQFAFRGSPEYVKILTEASVEAANIANNHTKDYGTDAFDDTKEILSSNNIADFGWSEYSIQEINGIKVGLIGTNALNASALEEYPQVFDNLKNENPDIIIASFHWGIEKDAFPTEQQKKLAHEAIDNGADLVIGHHPHVVQGIEKYNGKYILYSLGNFCFGGNKNPSDKDTFIFRQTFNFEEGNLIENDKIQVIPCSVSSVKSRNDYCPTPLTDNEYERVKNKILERSSKFEGYEEYIDFIN